MHHTSVEQSSINSTHSPAISVIVPVFNGERSIRRCLCSLTAQSMRDMEILVVYKPGDDNTWEQIHSVDDPRIRIIVQEDDLGPGGARNLGIDATVGTYIGFVEADDFVDANFYEALYRNIESHNADIAFAGTLQNSRELIVHDTVRELSGFAEIMNSLPNGASFDKLFRGSMIRERHIRFSERVSWEDNIFLIKSVYFSRSVVMVPHVFYHYCPEHWTEERKRRLERDASSVVYEIAAFARDVELSPAEKEVLRAFIFRSFVSCVWDVSSVYRTMQDCFGVPLPLTLRHYRKKAKRLWRKARQAVLKGVIHG